MSLVTHNAFTEQDIAMLSSALKSQRAVEVNISIMRAFVEMRKMITETDDLREMIISLENKYDDQFKAVFSALQQIIRGEPTGIFAVILTIIEHWSIHHE